MPDISMCVNTSCKARQQCYRFTATPNEYGQNYALFKPKNENGCEYKMILDQD